MLKNIKNVQYIENNESNETLQSNLNNIFSSYSKILKHEIKKEKIIIEKKAIEEKINELPFISFLLSTSFLFLFLCIFALFVSMISTYNFKLDTIKEYGSFEVAEKKYVELYSKTLDEKKLKKFQSEPYYKDINFTHFIYKSNNGASSFASIYRNQNMNAPLFHVSAFSTFSIFLFYFILRPLIIIKRKRKNKTKIDELNNEIKETEKFINNENQKYLNHFNTLKEYSKLEQPSPLNLKNVFVQHFINKGYSKNLIDIILDKNNVDFQIPIQSISHDSPQFEIHDNLTYKIESDINQIINSVKKSKHA